MPKVRLSNLPAPFDDHVVLSVQLARPAAFAALTKSEVEVAEGLLTGASHADVARERGVSKRTIERQLESIYRKLGVSSRYELVAFVSQARTASRS
jgi:DNA-binding NarL/FixJ family response regulator